MADISFGEDQPQRIIPPQAPDPYLVRLLRATGIVADRKSAEKLLLAIGIIAVLGILATLVTSSSGHTLPHTGSTATYTGPSGS